MPLKQLFEKVNSYFHHITLKDRFIIYTLPLLLMSSYFYHFENNSISSLDTKNQIEAIEKRIDILNNPPRNAPSLINLLKKSETYALRNDIVINSTKMSKETLQLHLSTSLLNLFRFVDFIENNNAYSKIKGLEISNLLDGKYQSYLEITLGEYQLKKTVVLPSLLYSTKIGKTVKEKKSQPIPLKLEAIVGKHVLINQQWLELYDKVFEHQLILVNKYSVRLKSKEGIVNLMLQGYENAK